MATAELITLLQESIFTVVVFVIFLVYAMVKGKYAVINIIFALYLALIISIYFPYYDVMTTAEGGNILGKIIIFVVFTVVGVVLFRKHIPGDDFEPAFKGFAKKVLLAVMATILVMAFSFHALPVTEIITPSTPIQHLFAPEKNFFWWLILPIVALFFV